MVAMLVSFKPEREMTFFVENFHCLTQSYSSQNPRQLVNIFFFKFSRTHHLFFIHVRCSAFFFLLRFYVRKTEF